MIVKPPSTNIAYRCPSCGTTIYGFVGKFSLAASMIRLKCPCQASTLDITMTNDKKVRLSVPCLFCAQNHNYTVSQNVFFDKDLFLLACPYSNMDIAFIGEKEKCDEALTLSEEKLKRLLSDLEAESLSDIQPQDVGEDSVPPDPAIYDTLNFVVRDLEAEGEVHCPCQSGEYDLRFTDDGMQVYCKNCGATYDFYARSVSVAEEYLTIDSITLR